MPLVFSNKVTSNPLSLALNNKINPSPLTPPAKSVNPFTVAPGKVQLPYIGNQAQSTPATTQPANKYASMSDDEMTAYLQNKNKAATPAVKPIATTSTQTGTPQATGSFQSQLADIQRQAEAIKSQIPNATQQQYPQQQQAPQQQSTPTSLYSSLIGALTSQGLGNQNTQGIVQQLTNMGTQKPQFQTINGTQYNTDAENFDPYSIANKNLQEFNTKYAMQEANNAALPLGVEEQTGRAQAYAKQAAATQGALQTAISNILEQQGQKITALNNAGGISNTQQGLIQQALQQAGSLASPIQVPYTNQLLNPASGQNIQGGSNGSVLNPLNSVQSYAQMVLSGQMSPSQAASALGNNPAFTAALNQAISQGNSNFNFPQAEANAAAQGQALTQNVQLGGQLQKQAETVTQHMTTLQNAYNNLGAQYGLPLLNRGVNAIASQFGSGPLQSYKLALSNVRDELAKVLGGGSATEGTRHTAEEILPDNMTPAQIQAAISTASELMSAKIKEYTTAGNVPQYGNNQSTGGGGLFNW